LTRAATVNQEIVDLVDVVGGDPVAGHDVGAHQAAEDREQSEGEHPRHRSRTERSRSNRPPTSIAANERVPVRCEPGPG